METRMPEPANADALSVTAAIQTLQRYEGFEARLYLRTEGMTWMLWGLVAAGIFLTYQAVAPFVAGHDFLLVAFLWMPWSAAGVLATVALWRGARAANPGPATREDAAKGL